MSSSAARWITKPRTRVGPPVGSARHSCANRRRGQFSEHVERPSVGRPGGTAEAAKRMPNGDDPAAARATASRIWDATPGPSPAVHMANQLGFVFAKLDCRPRWRERLSEIDIPTVVIDGRRDRFFPVGNGTHVRSAPPDCSSSRTRPRRSRRQRRTRSPERCLPSGRASAAHRGTLSLLPVASRGRHLPRGGSAVSRAHSVLARFWRVVRGRHSKDAQNACIADVRVRRGISRTAASSSAGSVDLYLAVSVRR